MKKIAPIMLILFLVSCKKDKQVSIVGTWREISVYSGDNSGNFYWSGPPRFPYILTLDDDGKYFGWSCVPADKGFYQYDHANKRVRFESIPSGNVDTIAVSFLNDEYLIFDYSVNGVVEYRQKFIRAQF
jgi:hypothetical protein